MSEDRPKRRRARQPSVLPVFVYAAVLLLLLGTAVARAQEGGGSDSRPKSGMDGESSSQALGKPVQEATGIVSTSPVQPAAAGVNQAQKAGQPAANGSVSSEGPKAADSSVSGGIQGAGSAGPGLASVSGRTQVTISAAGDCTLGTDEHFNASTSLPAMYKAKGADWFFAGVKSIFEEDDLTLVNLEGTFTTSTARADKTFAFKADPEYVGILTSGSVEAVNVANNHSRDYGQQSFTDTVNTVQSAGIAVSGYDQVAVVEKNGVKIGMTGLSLLSGMEGKEEQLKTNIDSLRAQGANLIITSFHWGIEKENTPTADQVAMAHAAIDAGADLVIGHHPHVLQGIEVYKGKYICYSLGNFCFGGNKNPKDKDTMIFQQTFTFVDGSLQENEEVNIIPCRLSSVSNRNDYQPTPVSGSEAERINQRIEEFSNRLQ